MPKSSAYPPLDGLFDLACRDGVDIRPTLLRVVTDLYVQKPAHSAEEETQYVELALGLIESVDEATRAAVAASLSAYAAAPAAILDRLSGRTPAPEAPDEPQDAELDLVESFFAATPAERRLILVNLDVPAAAARRPLPAGGEIMTRLEAAALQRNVSEFARVLERALGVSDQLAERIARDASGEPLVVAARALGMTAAVLQRVLLFLNPAIGQSIERVYALADLFIELAPQTAEHMLSIWRESGVKSGENPAARRRAPHQPVHYDDERRSARSPATPSRHNAARPREDLTRVRNKVR